MGKTVIDRLVINTKRKAILFRSNRENNNSKRNIMGKNDEESNENNFNKSDDQINRTSRSTDSTSSSNGKIRRRRNPKACSENNPTDKANATNSNENSNNGTSTSDGTTKISKSNFKMMVHSHNGDKFIRYENEHRIIVYKNGKLIRLENKHNNSSSSLGSTISSNDNNSKNNPLSMQNLLSFLFLCFWIGFLFSFLRAIVFGRSFIGS